MSAEAATSVEARRGSRHDEFVQAAAHLFAERGYAGTSVDDVGNRLGVSGPAIYWHFASKEALLTEMLSDISDRLLAGGSAASSRPGATTRRWRTWCAGRFSSRWSTPS